MSYTKQAAMTFNTVFFLCLTLIPHPRIDTQQGIFVASITRKLNLKVLGMFRFLAP